MRAHRPYGVSCVLVGMTSSSATTSSSNSRSSSSSGSISPCIYATEPSGVVQEYRAVCVGENADAITTRLETHAADLPKMNVGQLARFAARVLWDARAEAASGGVGEKEEEGKERGSEEGGGEVELEVLLLTWEGGKEGEEKGGREGGGKGKVMTRRLFVKSLKEIEALGKLLHLGKEGREGGRREGEEEGGRAKDEL